MINTLYTTYDTNLEIYDLYMHTYREGVVMGPAFGPAAEGGSHAGAQKSVRNMDKNI